jgi:CRISPR system Cascade subunit CasB
VTTADARPHYWAQPHAGAGAPPGEALAALRRGAGREPGSVPEMWRYYTTLTEGGGKTFRLQAEHEALVLFGFHQQGRIASVHVEGVSIGRALRRLKTSGRYSGDALDRRVAAAATASTLGELAVHLRGLVQQMRAAKVDQLDYTRLFRDLLSWQYPGGAARVRRQWGAAYFALTPKTPTDPSNAPGAATDDPEENT